jgi:hypothetical protein
MDNGLLFPYRSYRGKGGTREGRLSMPNGHGVFLILGEAGAGKSTPDIIAEDGGKLRGDPRQLSWTHAAKKSLVIVEI